MAAMRSITLAVVVAILVVASLGTGYLAGNRTRQTETQTVAFTTSVGQPIQAADVLAANITGAGSGVFDVNASRVYVESGQFVPEGSMNYSVGVIDTSSNTVVANVSLPPITYNPKMGFSCSNLIVDDSTDMAYVIYTGGGVMVNGTTPLEEIIAVNGSTDTVEYAVPLSLGNLAPDFSCAESLDSTTDVLWATATYQEPGPAHPEPLVGNLLGIDALTGSVVKNISLGFAAGYAAVDPYTGMVYVDGCIEYYPGVCDSQQLAIINGASGSLVTTVDLDNPFYPYMAMDLSTDIIYVSGGSQLAAVNMTNGNVIFKVYPQSCGGFNISVIPATNQVLLVPLNYLDYMLVYDGTNGTLVNMYSFSNNVYFAGYDTNTGELYVTVGADMLALHYDVQATGNVNASLIDMGCALPDE
jgi:hypothetical protein